MPAFILVSGSACAAAIHGHFVCLIFQYGWLRQKSNTYILLTEIFVSVIVYVLMELSSILAWPKEYNLVNILRIMH